jgi:hypothetical protein
VNDAIGQNAFEKRSWGWQRLIYAWTVGSEALFPAARKGRHGPPAMRQKDLYSREARQHTSKNEMRNRDCGFVRIPDQIRQVEMFQAAVGRLTRMEK